MTAVPVPAPQPFSGLRPVSLRQDLGAIADLIEVCFVSTLDSAGRAAIREMRMLTRSGSVLWTLNRLSTASVNLLQGFVWIDNDRLVGNVSVSPAGYGKGYVIANVAVHPAFRRRGIARHLMQAALDLIARKEQFAILQVDADNAGARALYEELGFIEQRTFIRWRRDIQRPQTAPAPSRLTLQRAGHKHTDALVALAQQVRPESQGGMGWLRPIRRADFRTPWWAGVGRLATGQMVQHWVVPGPNGRLDAALLTEGRMRSTITVFDALVHPERQGELEDPLIYFAVRRLDGWIRALVTQHPADDAPASAALRAQGFRSERMLVHMFWRPPQPSPQR